MSSLIFTKSLGSTTIGILEPGIFASMAEDAHFKELQEAQNKTNQLLQVETMKRAVSEIKIQQQFAGIDHKFEHITNTLAELQLRLLKLVPISTAGNDSVLRIYDSTSRFGNKSGFRNDSVLGVFYQTHGGIFVASQNHVHTPLSRMDFPRFDGTNPRAWVLKSSNYFKVMPNVPDVEKINLAIKHFDGKALTWIQSLNMVEVRITWKQFLEVVCARFEVVPISSMILEFNKLKHNGNYDEYVERFEELRTYVMLNDSNKYSEDYFIAKFLSGLSEELQAFINISQPTNLEHTIELGRKQIHTFDAISKRISSDASSVQIQFSTHKRIDAVSPQISSRLSIITSTNPRTKKLTTAGMKTEGEILDAPEVIKLGIPEVESNLVQAVKEVHKFWKLLNAQEVANFKHPDTGWRDSGQIDDIFVLQNKNSKKDIPPDLVPMLEEYVGICEESVGLLPSRRMEHQLQLKPGIIPKQQYSYKTPHSCKDDIRKIVQEMFKARIIQHGRSHFAFPVILVQRQDNTWRMCVADSKQHTNTFTMPPTKMLISSEMAARRKKLLCYNGDKLSGCKQRINYAMMTKEEVLLGTQETTELEKKAADGNIVPNIDELQISLHSVMGNGGIMVVHMQNQEPIAYMSKTLSSTFDQECAAMPTTLLRVPKVIHSYQKDAFVTKILTTQVGDKETCNDFTLSEEILLYKGKLVLGTDFQLRTSILAEVHKSSYDGHSEVQETYMRLKNFFYWPRMKSVVEALAHKFGYDLSLGRDWLLFRIFTAFLNWKKVKFKPLTTAVDKTHITYSVLCSSVHPQIHEKGEAGVLTTKLEKATHPQTAGLLYMFLSHYLHFLVFYRIQEHKEFQKFIQQPRLPERDNDENFKIALLLVLDNCIVTRQGENVPQISIRWLSAGPDVAMWKDDKFIRYKKHTTSQEVLEAGLEFATLKDENCICRKLPSLDPRGRGSSAAGGIVMAYVGVNGGGDGVKEKGWSLEFDLEEKLESGADLGKKRDQKERKKISWAIDYCYWTIHKLMGGWSVAVGLVEV